ncbi:MAG: antibiotic biosynthesis monooxygenase [Flavobacteriales bacterium]|nr:antibiotic biosynthesis monooxygenase [Flavobacteriales bacterium]
MPSDHPFAVLYAFHVKPGLQDDFILSWTELTQLIYESEGSCGSRLHRSDDHLYIAYAAWPSRQLWVEASDGEQVKDDATEEALMAAREKMRECCSHIETLHTLETVTDLLE